MRALVANWKCLLSSVYNSPAIPNDPGIVVGLMGCQSHVGRNPPVADRSSPRVLLPSCRRQVTHDPSPGRLDPLGEGDRDDTTTPTDDRGYAAAGAVRKDAGRLRPRGAPARRALSPEAPTRSLRRICASISCISPTTRRSPAPRRRSPCAVFGSSSSTRSSASGQRSDSYAWPVSRNYRWS